MGRARMGRPIPSSSVQRDEVAGLISVLGQVVNLLLSSMGRAMLWVVEQTIIALSRWAQALTSWAKKIVEASLDGPCGLGHLW